MKTESNYTADVVKSLRTFLPNAVILKLADTFTMGVPDFFVNVNGVTSWFEAKRPDLSKNPKGLFGNEGAFLRLKPKDEVPAVQWETLRKLKRGWVVIYTVYGHGIFRVTNFRDKCADVVIQLTPMADLVSEIIRISTKEPT